MHEEDFVCCNCRRGATHQQQTCNTCIIGACCGQYQKLHMLQCNSVSVPALEMISASFIMLANASGACNHMFQKHERLRHGCADPTSAAPLTLLAYPDIWRRLIVTKHTCSAGTLHQRLTNMWCTHLLSEGQALQRGRTGCEPFQLPAVPCRGAVLGAVASHEGACEEQGHAAVPGGAGSGAAMA